MQNLLRVEVVEVLGSTISASIYEMIEGSDEESVLKTIYFHSFLSAKNWIDENWQSAGLGEHWLNLFLIRYISGNENSKKIMFSMEYAESDDGASYPRLVAFECNDDDSKNVFAIGMTPSINNISFENIPKIWSILFSENLIFDDIYPLFGM